jgi:PASTA domain
VCARLLSNAARPPPQAGHTNPSGQRRASRNAAQVASSGKPARNSLRVRALATPAPLAPPCGGRWRPRYHIWVYLGQRDKPRTPVLILGTNFFESPLLKPSASLVGGIHANIVGSISNTALTIIVPNNALVGDGFITVTTYGGNWSVNSPELFVVDPNVMLVSVPTVTNQSLQNAVGLLQQAGLQVGTVSGPSGLDLVVVGQSPAAGARILRGNKVNLWIAAADNPGSVPLLFRTTLLTEILSISGCITRLQLNGALRIMATRWPSVIAQVQLAGWNLCR